MHNLDNWKFDKIYFELNDISLENELIKNYNGYPKGVVTTFIRNGASNVFEMKELLKRCVEEELQLRNLGTSRLNTAEQLIVKYEVEALLER